MERNDRKSAGIRLTASRMTVMAAVAATAFAACSSDKLGKDVPQGKGAVIGAVAGAAAAQVLGKDVGALGTVLAAAAGAYIGSKVMKDDRVEQSLARNEPATLTTETGEQLRIDPAGTTTQNGRTCRQFTITRINSPGAQPSTATACEDTAGQWRLASAQ